MTEDNQDTTDSIKSGELSQLITQQTRGYYFKISMTTKRKPDNTEGRYDYDEASFTLSGHTDTFDGAKDFLEAATNTIDNQIRRFKNIG